MQLRAPVPVLVLSLVTALPLAAAAQEAPGYSVAGIGDTIVKALGDDEFAAASESDAPGVTFRGQTMRIQLRATTDASLGPPELLALSAETASDSLPTGTFRLTFNGQTTASRPNYFDGRFLSARDTTREQSYRPSADWAEADAFVYELSLRGQPVARFASTGAAPFVLARLPDAFASDDLTFETDFDGGTNATTDDGAGFTIDHVEVHATHELGHIYTLHHEHTKRSVQVSGVPSLWLAVENE